MYNPDNQLPQIAETLSSACILLFCSFVFPKISADFKDPIQYRDRVPTMIKKIMDHEKKTK